MRLDAFIHTSQRLEFDYGGVIIGKDMQYRDGKMMTDVTQREHIGEELADILFFVLRFAQLNRFDLGEILSDKIEKNDKKYPVAKVKGSNLKYSERLEG